LLSSFNSDSVASNTGSGGITRYYNLPFYTLFALLYYANQLFKKVNPISILPVIILLAAIVISFNRNTEAAALFGLILIFFHKRKITIINIGAIAIIATVFLIITISNQADRGKYEGSDLKTITDLNRLKDPSRVNESKISTVRFRILHFYERYLYVYDHSALTYFTGIGLVSDQYLPLKNQLNFNIGTINFFNQSCFFFLCCTSSLSNYPN
jgi:hypothetical protein